MDGVVVAVCRSGRHEFSKTVAPSVTLLAGLGVEADAHMGVTVKHRSRVARDPHAPNLRQVHLIHRELFDELAAAGFVVGPGDLGENVTTSGIDLLGLPTGTRLHLGSHAIVEVTGLRNPCTQIDGFQEGLLSQVAHRGHDGSIVRKAGIMGIVLTTGVVRPNDRIQAVVPDEPHRPLERV